MKPETPPITNSRIMLAKNRKAVVITGRPSPDRRGPGEHRNGARDRDDDRGAAEERQRQVGQSGGEHVVHPHAEAEDHGGDGRQRHRRIADQRPAAEHRQPVGDDAHRRQHDRVDPGMAEHPEQMLPQQRLAALRTSKKCVPNWRSIHSRKKARLTAGTTSRFAAEAVDVPQTRIGSRLSDMPGARVRSRVTMKLAEPTVVEMPRKIIPSA